MSGKIALSLSFLLLAAQTQAACMTDVAPSSCNVEGAKHLGPSVSEAEVCEAFRAQLAEKLGDTQDSASFNVSLVIADNGTIDAFVTDASGASVTPHESVSLDVMDRTPSLSDVEKLAETVASLIEVE